LRRVCLVKLSVHSRQDDTHDGQVGPSPIIRSRPRTLHEWGCSHVLGQGAPWTTWAELGLIPLSHVNPQPLHHLLTPDALAPSSFQHAIYYQNFYFLVRILSRIVALYGVWRLLSQESTYVFVSILYGSHNLCTLHISSLV
jgi:hypothetical protein